MKYRHLILTAAAVLLLTGFGSPVEGSFWKNEDRTSNRTILGDIIYPQWVMETPEHYEFSPLKSNHDPQTDMPEQWAGQDWDTSKWDGKDQTPQLAIRRFYAVRIFTAQYAEHRVPVLELGPRFWQLSDLDRRRAIKLVAEHTHVFEKGAKTIVLRDWKTKDNIGEYTPKGMYLK
jgi:hypothetical protein